MVLLYDMLCPTVLIKETNICQLDHLDHLGDYVHSGHTGPLMGPTIRSNMPRTLGLVCTCPLLGLSYSLETNAVP